MFWLLFLYREKHIWDLMICHSWTQQSAARLSWDPDTLSKPWASWLSETPSVVPLWLHLRWKSWTVQLTRTGVSLWIQLGISSVSQQSSVLWMPWQLPNWIHFTGISLTPIASLLNLGHFLISPNMELIPKIK